MSLLNSLRRLADRLDDQSRRERLMLAAALAVVLLLVWDIGLRAPLAERHASALERIERGRGDVERLRASADELVARIRTGGRDQDATAAIEQRLSRVDARLTERTRRIIGPHQMVRVLRDVLAADDRLRLITLRNAGAEPVTEAPSAGGATAGAALPRIYRHQVELVVEGSYFALLAYLQRLEGLDWRFQWDALRLETTDYPTARATLSMSTLSLTEDWIGA